MIKTSGHQVSPTEVEEVVLQSGLKGEEDGSLSRTCARLGVRYVNLEVGAGKLTT